MKIEDEVVIAAPGHVVWEAIEDVAAHAAWHPLVTGIVGAHALGSARTCSVRVGGKAGETVERCVEYEPERRIIWAIERDTTGFSRMVRDWRAGFRLESRNGETTVVAVSSFTPRPLVRVLAPIVRRKFHRTQAEILGALRDSIACTPSAAKSGATPGRVGGTS
jgi:uncharacterized protein YndB with AHSA1/START domain